MNWLDVVSRIVHVGTAIVLVGGATFLRFVLLPAAERIEQSAHEALADSIREKWKRFVHLGIVLLLASGFYNYVRALPLHQGDSLYHALVGTKILAAFVVFFIASALVGRSPALESVRRHRKRWLAILLILAAIIVAISGFVKVRGASSPDRDIETSTPPVADLSETR
ncbi:MAG: hypothetical protein KatS3mg111_0124 [Pirellulaceae bacterium]|nr:MAG: hypothetical protein KatS3mg111_0124 [Pirellulaceae bacterium]